MHTGTAATYIPLDTSISWYNWYNNMTCCAVLYTHIPILLVWHLYIQTSSLLTLAFQAFDTFWGEGVVVTYNSRHSIYLTSQEQILSWYKFQYPMREVLRQVSYVVSVLSELWMRGTHNGTVLPSYMFASKSAQISKWWKYCVILNKSEVICQ